MRDSQEAAAEADALAPYARTKFESGNDNGEEEARAAKSGREADT
jgi:hypothetical protein